MIDRNCTMDIWRICPTTKLANATDYYTKKEVDDILQHIPGFRPDSPTREEFDDLEQRVSDNAQAILDYARIDGTTIVLGE